MSHISKPPLTPSQCRAARGLLGWSQTDLAQRSLVSRSTIASFEQGERVPTDANLATLRNALEQAGVLFIPTNGGGIGVRFRDTDKT